jgi:hypothetical protein
VNYRTILLLKHDQLLKSPSKWYFQKMQEVEIMTNDFRNEGKVERIPPFPSTFGLFFDVIGDRARGCELLASRLEGKRFPPGQSRRR